VLNLLGKGAMGEVYAAYDPELDRKVAIKLLRGKAGNEAEAAAGRARMMREAQAIAKLSHPNVVVVYDVGAHEDKVFVAMEFVDGHTLWYWSHAAPRAWPDVLKIFADAGRGLAAAHDKGLVHRDFKPENVMISADGQVRVMDFGLARSIGSRITPDGAPETTGAAPSPAVAQPPPNASSSEEEFIDVDSTMQLGKKPGSNPLSSSGIPLNLDLTQTGTILGTPAYMSPEQFRGQDTDARTDQFSFCVALYEALYGERPFLGNTPQTLEASVIRGIVRDPPPRTDVPAWIRKVVLRGLSSSVEERWPSMNHLLGELEQKRLFVGRQHFAESAAEKLSDIWPVRTTSSVAVEGEPGDSPLRAEVRAAFLATGKQYAATAFETVSRALDRYVNAWADMYVDICEATHVRGEQSSDVMDLRMASLMDLRERLRVLCRIFRQADGDVVEKAVGAANALGSIERCADLAFLRSAVKPPEGAAMREAVDRLRSRLAEARVLGQVGRLNRGHDTVAEIEEETRALGYLPLVAEMLLESGKLYTEQRDDAAGRVLEEAVWAAQLCGHDEVVAEAASILIFVVGDTQLRFDVAEIWSRFAETTLRRMGGHDVLWGWLYNNRGAMRSRQGRLAEALEDGRAAVAAKERVAGANSLDSPDVAQSMGNIANFLNQACRAEEALPYIERTVRVMAISLGPDHPRGAIMSHNYAEILNEVGRFSEAEEVARTTLAIFEREFGADDVLVTYPLTALGVAALGTRKIAEARAVLERAAALCTAKENDPAHLGEVLFALARTIAATSGADADRARALAVRAGQEYGKAAPSPLVVRERGRIEQFLASTPAQ
jgi:serine/threonine protein kinase/tetratricopeptide (TPR) repeat protein